MDSQEEEKVKWHIVSAFVFYNKKIAENFIFIYGRFSHCFKWQYADKTFFHQPVDMFSWAQKRNVVH